MGLRKSELNRAEGVIQGEANGRVLVQLDNAKKGTTVAVTHTRLTSQPPGIGSQG